MLVENIFRKTCDNEEIIIQNTSGCVIYKGKSINIPVKHFKRLVEYMTVIENTLTIIVC